MVVTQTEILLNAQQIANLLKITKDILYYQVKHNTFPQPLPRVRYGQMLWDYNTIEKYLLNQAQFATENLNEFYRKHGRAVVARRR